MLARSLSAVAQRAFLMSSSMGSGGGKEKRGAPVAQRASRRCEMVTSRCDLGGRAAKVRTRGEGQPWGGVEPDTRPTHLRGAHTEQISRHAELRARLTHLIGACTEQKARTSEKKARRAQFRGACAELGSRNAKV